MPETRVNRHGSVTVSATKGACIKTTYQNSVLGEKSCQVGCLEKSSNLLIRGHRQPEETLQGRSQRYKYPDLSLLFDLLTGLPTG